MIVRSIRRLTSDSFHNAFTGAAWFQGALYVGYRQGDAHVCDQGRLVVQRSRDGGVHFDWSPRAGTNVSQLALFKQSFAGGACATSRGRHGGRPST